MKAELVNVFVESVQNLFSTMLGCEAKPVRAGLADGSGSPETLTALIGLSGHVRGTVALELPVETALAVVGRILGTEKRVVDEAVKDGVAELVNMAAGGAKIRLSSEKGPTVDLGLPRVLRNSKPVVDYPSRSTWLEVPFRSGLGPFVLRVVFESDINAAT